MSQGDTAGDVRILETQTRQVGADGSIKVKLTCFDQPHGERGSNGLGSRADLEESVFCNGQGLLYVSDAEASNLRIVPVQEAECDTRNVKAGHFVLDQGAEFSEEIV